MLIWTYKTWIREKLHLKEMSDGKKTQIPKAVISIAKDETSIFYDVLKTTKFPDDLAYNTSHCVQVNEGNISGYKTYHVHIMLHYLLQVEIKGITVNQVVIPFIRVCSVFRCLCQKIIEVKTLDHLDVEIAETLCQLECIFPPSFFYAIGILIHGLFCFGIIMIMQHEKEEREATHPKILLKLEKEIKENR